MAFTLAHLSDPHLAPLPVPRFDKLAFKQFAGYVNWLRSRRFIHQPAALEKILEDVAREKPDHTVISGDLANIAQPFEFARGRDWLARFGKPEHVSIVPGNHDIYVPGTEALAQQYWGDNMRSDTGEIGFPYVRRRGPLALIGLGSGVPTDLFYASGQLGADQLAKLAATLDALKSNGTFRVVIIHHPPVSASSHRKRLIDAGELIRVIAEHGAELLIHGHDHLPMLNWLSGPNATRVPAIGVPSASAAPGKGKAPAGYNLYRVEGTPNAWRCEMISRGIRTEDGVTEIKRTMLTG